MRIIHRVCLNNQADAKVLKKMQSLGVLTREVGTAGVAQMAVFEIAEDSAMWDEVNRVLTKAKVQAVTTRTEFSDEEIVTAEWVRVRPSSIQGYPMPETNNGWRTLSFDANTECAICGIGRQQIAPIQLKSEPKMRDVRFVGLNWILDILACLDVLAVMAGEGITGFSEREVIHYRSGNPIQTVKQLVVPCELTQAIVDRGLEKYSPACGHTKYIGLTAGKYTFHKEAFKKCPDFVRTFEWFGAGRQAAQLVLASSVFVALYLRCAWKGLILEPIDMF